METKNLIDVLNKLLEDEIAALEYYRMHAEAIPEEHIADGVKAILPAELSHAVNLSKRIEDLGGTPVQPGGNASSRGKEMGEESKQKGTFGMINLQLEQEKTAIKAYAAALTDNLDDPDTADMLEEQLFDEIRHAKWLQNKVMELKGA